jgi:exopolysaccharide production protein ExoZ
VVVFHIGEIFGHTYSFGANGVDVFFVISGFIMCMVTQNKEVSINMFLLKRVIRIVPLYWILTVSMAICAWLRPNLFPLDNPHFSHVILSMLFVPHEAPDGRVAPLITQGWTLNYEMFFYLVFATTLALNTAYRTIVLSIILVGLVCYGYLGTENSPIAITYTSPLLLEFLAGVYICRAWLNDTVLGKGNALIAIGMGVTCIAAAYCYKNHLPREIVSGIPAILIVFGAVSLERANFVPKVKTLKLLGDASYSIYLTHYLSWLVVSIVVAHLGIRLGQPIYGVTVLCGISLGVAVYYFIEKPISKLLSCLFVK